MASKKIWLGILVIVLVFGMIVVGCDNGSTDNGNTETSDFDGTWISTTIVQDSHYLKIIASGGSFIQSSRIIDATIWLDIIKGTYSKHAKSPVTATVTEVNTIIFGPDDEWETWSNLGEYQQQVPQTMPITISDNQFTLNNVTYARE